MSNASPWVKLGIILSILGVYVVWPGHSAFLYEILFDIFGDYNNFGHPLVLCGIVGYGIIIFSLMINVHRWLEYLAIGLLGIVVLLFLVAGVMSVNLKMIWSTIPFFLLVSYYILTNTHRRLRSKSANI